MLHTIRHAAQDCRQNRMDKSHFGRPSKCSRPGRPVEEEAFQKVLQYLIEHDNEMLTLSDLTCQMTEILGGDSTKTYTEKHMRNKLKQHLGDDVAITTINGKANVATLRHSADRILLDFHANQSKDSESERMQIIEAASKLIRQDIKAMETTYLAYPRTDEQSTSDKLFKDQYKQ